MPVTMLALGTALSSSSPVAVHAVRRQRAQLEERAARVEQGVDPVAHQQLAAVGVLAPGALRPALPDQVKPFSQLLDEVSHLGCHATTISG